MSAERMSDDALESRDPLALRVVPITETRLAAPLVPAEVDLRDFAFMPLDVLRLRDSDLAGVQDAEVFRCSVLSWCVAWHQMPAGSLPDDDVSLARLLGLGRDVTGWKRLRAGGALRGWVLCSDGLLYHPVVAEKALDAWRGKLEQRWRTEAARVRKHNQRHKLEGANAIVMPEFEEWLSLGRPMGQPLPVTGTKETCLKGHPPAVPSETSSKGQGEGQGQGEGEGLDKEGVASQPLSGLPPDSPPIESGNGNGNNSEAARKAALARQRSTDAKAILLFLNEKAGKAFPPSDTNVGIIVARMKEGFTPAQLRQVVAMKVRAWKTDERMAQYLRPETLFRRIKFSQYVGELVDVPDDAQSDGIPS